MRHSTLLATLGFSLLLTACVDTTGLTGTLFEKVHPTSNPNAAVVVSEYADLQCPACRAAHEAIVKPLTQTYGQQIRYEFHHFPLRAIHQFALEAAEAAECAGDQGKFWEYVDLTYTNQPDLSRAKITEWAESLGIDMDTFGRCTKSHIKRDAILAEYEEGKTRGVNGTPTFFVNGERVDSSLDALSAAIDAKKQGILQKL